MKKPSMQLLIVFFLVLFVLSACNTTSVAPMNNSDNTNYDAIDESEFIVTAAAYPQLTLYKVQQKDAKTVLMNSVKAGSGKGLLSAYNKLPTSLKKEITTAGKPDPTKIVVSNPVLKVSTQPLTPREEALFRAKKRDQIITEITPRNSRAPLTDAQQRIVDYRVEAFVAAYRAAKGDWYEFTVKSKSGKTLGTVTLYAYGFRGPIRDFSGKIAR